MYQRGTLSATNLEALAESLRVELDKVALQLSQPTDYIALKTLYAQPERYFEGMIVRADGTNWNPGSGAGVYCRTASGWAFLG